MASTHVRAARSGQWTTVREAKPSRLPRGNGGSAELALPLLIGLAAIYGATSVTTLPYERVFFGAIVLLSMWLAVPPREITAPRMLGSLILGWGLIWLSYAYISVLMQPSWSANYFVGDATLALLPLFVMLGFTVHPGWLKRRTSILLLLALLGIAAVGARLVGMLGMRHEAPSSLLIAGVWYFALEADARRVRWCLAYPLVAAVGLLCYSSGYRTHLILWIAAPFVIRLLLRGFWAVVRACLALALIIGVAVLGGVEIDLVDTFRESRFQSILSGRPDESLGTRFAELHDVGETIEREWIPGQSVFGYGFGAAYQPQRSFIDSNVGDDGRVHNIHFGPALVFFRFGYLGLVIFAAMLAVVVQTLRDLRMDEVGPFDRSTVAILGVGLLLFSIEFLVLNSTVQPAMSFCLGGVLAVWLLSKERP